MAEFDLCEIARQDETSMEYDNEKFSQDEETLVAIMFKLVGERWALIAGRIPGRTPEEIKMYWTSTYILPQNKNEMKTSGGVDNCV